MHIELDSKSLKEEVTNREIITELQYNHAVGLMVNHLLEATGLLISLKHVLSPMMFIDFLNDNSIDLSPYNVYVPPLTNNEKSGYYGIEDFAVEADREYGVLLVTHYKNNFIFIYQYLNKVGI